MEWDGEKRCKQVTPRLIKKLLGTNLMNRNLKCGGAW